ncbi:MAG TPA: hypothetical protein VLV30_08255 [Methanomicrobiales archaeon]|nr:hypothetical protein [Methanomicrobiales archaeon]
MAANSEIQCASVKSGDYRGIPTPRVNEAEQHVLETASDLLSSSPDTSYLMSFIVRMRYVPERDSCQVVIQHHYSPGDGHDAGTRDEIARPLSHEIRAAIGEKISAKACGYISASSSLDEDNLTDLFILYFFASNGGEEGGQGVLLSGAYQMNLTLRTFVPEMEDIAEVALGKCLRIIHEGQAYS